jgi:hypothetical protein
MIKKLISLFAIFFIFFIGWALNSQQAEAQTVGIKVSPVMV